MTMTDQFNDPGTSTGIDYKALNGALLLFTVDKVEAGVKTSLGEKDAVRCTNVAVLDGASKGEEFTDALVFPRVLQGQLRASVGGKLVLGRLGQGDAKPGQNPPWKLAPASDEERQIAQRYLTYKATQTAEANAPF